MSIAGFGVNAAVNGVTISGVQSWTGDLSIQELDGTTAADIGFERPDFGLASLRVSTSLVIDVTTGRLVVISAGTVLTNLQLFARVGAPLPIFSMPVARVFKSTPKGEINGRFTYDVEIRSVGPFVMNDPN